MKNKRLWTENGNPITLEKNIRMIWQGSKSMNNRGEWHIQLRKENILRKNEQVTQPKASEKLSQVGVDNH